MVLDRECECITGNLCALRDGPSGIAAEGTTFAGMQKVGIGRDKGKGDSKWCGGAKSTLLRQARETPVNAHCWNLGQL